MNTPTEQDKATALAIWKYIEADVNQYSQFHDDLEVERYVQQSRKIYQELRKIDFQTASRESMVATVAQIITDRRNT